MSVQPRPVDNVSVDNLFVGMPFFEFEPLLSGGGFGAGRNLGIVDSAELQKALETIQLITAQSGTTVVEREEVSRLELTLQLGIYNHEPANLQLLLGSESLTVQAQQTVAVTDELMTVLASDRFSNLAQRNITTALTQIEPQTNTDELVGTGQGGTFGETTGDFSLAFPIELLADITAFSVGGVDRLSDLVSGTSPMAGEIGVVIGASATSGQITFPSGEAPASGATIVATYTPSFNAADFTENADYVLDPLEGRVRFITSDKVKPGQRLEVGYSFTQLDQTRLVPFTQNSFRGRGTVRHLTDLGVNFIWAIPSIQIRITDDAFTWNRDGFAVTNVAVNILSDGSATPFGTWDSFPETP